MKFLAVATTVATASAFSFSAMSGAKVEVPEFKAPSINLMKGGDIPNMMKGGENSYPTALPKVPNMPMFGKQKLDLFRGKATQAEEGFKTASQNFKLGALNLKEQAQEASNEFPTDFPSEYEHPSVVEKCERFVEQVKSTSEGMSDSEAAAKVAEYAGKVLPSQENMQKVRNYIRDNFTVSAELNLNNMSYAELREYFEVPQECADLELPTAFPEFPTAFPEFPTFDPEYPTGFPSMIEGCEKFVSAVSAFGARSEMEFREGLQVLKEAFPADEEDVQKARAYVQKYFGVSAEDLEQYSYDELREEYEVPDYCAYLELPTDMPTDMPSGEYKAYLSYEEFESAIAELKEKKQNGIITFQEIASCFKVSDNDEPTAAPASD